MGDAPYRSSGVGSGEPLDCLFCGFELEPTANRCVKCGVPCASPFVADNLDALFSCPRCGDSLASSSFGRATIKSCEKCHGVFLPSLQFSIIVNDYVVGVELPLGSMLPPLPPGHEIDRIPIVKCIGCTKEMDRVNFASRSDAIIDVCVEHGIWLDAAELVPMLHFVKLREELGDVPLSRDEQADQTVLDQKILESKQRKFKSNIRTVFATLEDVRRRGF